MKVVNGTGSGTTDDVYIDETRSCEVLAATYPGVNGHTWQYHYCLWYDKEVLNIPQNVAWSGGGGSCQNVTAFDCHCK